MVKQIFELDKNLQFVSDSQDVQLIKDNFGSIVQEFDAFFVSVKDGDYQEIWGIHGIVPFNQKFATCIVLN